MRGRTSFTVFAVVVCLGVGLSAGAQWLHQPMAGAPRTPDGKINMTGPVPMLDGKPDLSGIWQVQAEPRAPGGLFGLGCFLLLFPGRVRVAAPVRKRGERAALAPVAAAIA